MTPTRRDYIRVGTVGAVASISGCLGFDSIIADESDSEEDSNIDSEQNESDTPEQESDDPETQVSESLEPRIATLSEYLDWLLTEYDSRRQSYTTTVGELHRDFRELNDRDMQDVSIEDIDRLSSDLEDAADHAREMFSEYYTSHYGFRSLSTRLQNDVRPSLRRSEYETASTDFNRISRQVARATSSETTSRYYPKYLVHQYPYIFFTDAENEDSISTNRVFEAYYETADDSLGVFAAPDQMNLRQHPFGVEQPTSEFDGRSPFPDRESDVFALAGWLSDNRAEYELYLNVIDYGLTSGSFPDSYQLGTRHGSADSVSDLSIPDFNNADSVIVYIQCFENEQTASQAAEQIKSDAVVESTATYYGTDYEQVFNSSTELGETVYADIVQVGQHVLCVDVNRTQWPERVDGSSEFDNNHERVEHHLGSTLFETDSEGQ